MNLYLHRMPRTPTERQSNKEVLELAKKIRFEKEQQFKKASTGYRIRRIKKINLFDAMEAYYQNYTKGDKRMIKLPYSDSGIS